VSANIFPRRFLGCSGEMFLGKCKFRHDTANPHYRIQSNWITSSVLSGCYTRSRWCSADNPAARSKASEGRNRCKTHSSKLSVVYCRLGPVLELLYGVRGDQRTLTDRLPLRNTVLEKLTVRSAQSRNSPDNEPEGSLPCSQKPATGPCPEPDKSSPHPSTLFP
jgi:hypothetical protein